MVRRHFFLIAALGVLALLLVGGALKLALGGDKPSARGPGGAGARAVAVSSATVGLRPFVDRIEVLGVAKGRQSVTITSNTAELVAAVHFRDGQAVSKGQVLVELKAGEEEAGIAQARAAAAQAERDYQRWTTLAEKGVAPRVTAEQYRAAAETARAVVRAAEARRLDRVIRAPFAGRVGLTDVAPGALISAGSPIVSLDDVSLIRVDFDVPDRYLPLLREGLPIVARSDAYPDQAITGRIAQLDTRIDEATRAITARAEFPNPGARLRPGMLMRVAIEQGRREGVAAPEAAVQFEGEQAYVFAIVQREGKAVAQKRPVTIGVNEGGFIEITEGLKAGEKIVADGLNRVQDGQAVRVGGGRPGAAGQGRQGGGQRAAR